jgi:hypothetical protein
VLPSIDIVLDEVRRRLDFQFELLNSHDFKASIVLGTSSVVIAVLLATLPLAQSQLDSLSRVVEYKIALSVLIGIPLLVLFTSIIISIIVLWIRNYNRPPRLQRLREHYIAEPQQKIQLQLIDNFMDAIDRNERIVKCQANLIRTASILLSIGLLTFIGLLSWFIMIFLKIIIL